MDGQVYNEDVLYKPIGQNGVFITCQNCDDTVHRPIWHMPGGTQVPSCNTSDVAVCFDWPKDTSRDLIFSGFEESSVGVYECRIASIIQFPKSINITVLGWWAYR